MHTFTKKYIDNLMKKCMFAAFEVSLIKFTKEDIENIKLSSIENKDIINKQEGIDDEPAEKKQKLGTNGIDVFKSVLSRESDTCAFESQLNSSLKPIKEIASTGIDEVPTVIYCDESAKPENSSAKNVWPRVNVIEFTKMMEKDKCILWKNRVDIKPNCIGNVKTNLTVAKNFTSKLNPPSHSTKVNELKYPLIAIKKIYEKYFGIFVLDTVTIIANILNMILISNKHFKKRMDESLKKKSVEEKLTERSDAEHIHETHKNILETKLKNNVVCVISSFAESEFDLAFKMVFLSILTVLRVLDQPTYGRYRIFDKLLLTLSTSLKNREYNHPKMFSIFRSKEFRTECIEIMSLIEDCRDSDPGIVNRMPLFFVSSVCSNMQYFQAAIDTVAGKMHENLELLIDYSTIQVSFNSNFKDFVDSSTVEHSNCKLPVTEIINSDIITEPTIRFKNQNQLIPEPIHGDKAQTIDNAGVEPSVVTTQPLNNFYDPFSSSVQKTMSASSSSTMIPTKKSTVVTQIISNSSLDLHQTASSSNTVTPVPSKRTRAVNINTNSPGKQPSIDAMKCSMNNCKKPAKKICSKCLFAKYCTVRCQRRHYIYLHHAECDDILRARKPDSTINFPSPI